MMLPLKELAMQRWAKALVSVLVACLVHTSSGMLSVESMTDEMYQLAPVPTDPVSALYALPIACTKDPSLKASRGTTPRSRLQASARVATQRARSNVLPLPSALCGDLCYAQGACHPKIGVHSIHAASYVAVKSIASIQRSAFRTRGAA